MLKIKEYVKAESLEQAYELNQKKTNCVIGGMLWLKMVTRNVQKAIDLSGLGLDQIEENDEEFSIGAMVTLRQIELHEGLNTWSQGAVKESVTHIVGVQFRNLATVGGSIFGKFGFSDVLSCFLAFDSYVELHHEGIIPLDQFAANKYPNDIAVITQNIDDMFEKAGCKGVIHLHGFLQELRCTKCKKLVNIGYEEQFEKHETCPKCKKSLRPNIVFFGEAAPKYETMHKILKDCGLLVVIGTSGRVIDVSFLTQYADYSILNNLEPSDAIYEECFTKVYYEDANIVYEKIEQDIENFIKNRKL